MNNVGGAERTIGLAYNIYYMGFIRVKVLSVSDIKQ